MIKRKQLLCTREGCNRQRYAKRLCGWCYLEEYPPARPAAQPRRATFGKVRKTSPKASPRASSKDIPAEVRLIVLERSGGLCEACGEELWGRVHLHHRLRRRDGLHVASNLVALHPDCHVNAPQAVHQRPTWAKERGLIVPFWGDPSVAPLTLASGRLVLLDDDGTYQTPPGGMLDAA